SRAMMVLLDNRHYEEEVSMSTITIGVDLAKSVFSVCEVEASGRVVRRLDLKRDAFATWLAQCPAGTVVAM
ncbi:transposase IS116/IS110/IS902 family protein, partial [Rhodanobacter spathiphylli B39]